MAKVKGEGSIYQRKSDGLWVASVDVGYTASGNRRRKNVYAPTRNAVIKKRRELLRNLEDGIDVINSSSTVERWVLHWIDEIHRPRVRPGVWSNYRGHLVHHVIPAVGKVKLAKLTPAHIREMHKAIAATPKQKGEGLVSGRTVEICHNVLSRSLKDAIREGLIRENPCEKVDKPKANSKIRAALTADQAKAVLASSISGDDDLATMWLAALLLGQRKSELIGLEWDRVDFGKHVIDLSWQLQQLPQRHGCGKQKADGSWPCGKIPPRYCTDTELDVREGFEVRPCHGALCWTRPKTTASVRAIPMPAMLEQALRRHRDEAPSNPFGLVWARPGGTPWHHRVVLDRWHAACDAAKIPRCDMHATRHTTATLLLEAGVSPEVIAQILGHSTVLSTRQYMHVSTELAAGALTNLGNVLGHAGQPVVELEAPAPAPISAAALELLEKLRAELGEEGAAATLAALVAGPEPAATA